jgi:pimeloyl-ACP methyl ester carboxylesterase
MDQLRLTEQPASGQRLEMARRRVHLADRALAYVSAGSGAPVILIHGTLTTLEDMMWPLGDALAPHHQVFAFDRPGVGRSAGPRWADAGIRRQARTLLEAIEALGLRRPILVGHSLGGSVALAMAAQAPDQIRGVVALAPLVLPEPRLELLLFGARAIPGGGDLLSWAANQSIDKSVLPALWRAMFLPQAMPRRIAETYPFDLAGRAEAVVRAGEDAVVVGADLLALSSTLGSCRVPARVFGGDRDAVVANDRQGRLLAALMPQATYTDLPGLGHMIHHFATDPIVEAVAALSDG